jgi:ATP/maltotriose-dependent transcriptional regulator MalT
MTLEWIGELDASRDYLRQSATVAKACGDLFHATWAASLLGSVALTAGDHEEALTLAREALRDFAQVGDLTGIMIHLPMIATALEQRGDRITAMRLHGAAATFARTNGSRYLAMERSLRRQADPADVAGADPEAAAAFEAGTRLSLDEAVALALQGPAA